MFKQYTITLMALILAQPAFADYKMLINKEARRQGVKPHIAIAIAMQESTLNPRKTNFEAGLYERKSLNHHTKLDFTALGLFQVVPFWQMERCGAKEPLDLMSPMANIRCGIKYIKYCRSRFKTDKKTIGCYNGDFSGDYYNLVRRYF